MKSKPPFAAESPSFRRPLVALTLTAFLFSLLNSGDAAQASHNPSLMISEVHPSALAGGSSLASNEWLEIHNPDPHPVNLGGWTVEDAQAIAPLPDLELPPNGTALVVGRSADLAVPAGQTLIVLDSSNIGTGLRNAGDRVALVDPYGVRHDAVSWGDVRRPRFIDPPNPGQSIVRTPSGGQSRSDSPNPWEIEQPLSPEPDRHRHARPDTAVRIISALIDPLDDEPESVTLRNISDQPLITVNWTLTVGSSLVKLRSVRIEPGESYTVTEPDGKIGGGLAASGGHLVLRDPIGNWLATASWGDDYTFHRLPAPALGQELRFSPFARTHPRVPWFESFNHAEAWLINDTPARSPLLPTEIANTVTRQRATSRVGQESEEPGIWISEVHPTTGQGRDEPAFEWFELTNATDEAVDLSGWSIADNTSSDLLSGLVIPPRSSIVVGVSAQADPSVIIAIVDGRIGNGLANAGDQLRLINAEGEVVNAISWGSDHSYTSVKSPNADESLHRASPSAAPTIGAPSPGTPPAPLSTSPSNPEPTEDAPSTDEPAPAETSDQQPTEAAAPPVTPPATREEATPQPRLQITEILPAPLPGEAEWVELHNPTDQAIDLSGWAIGDAGRRTQLSGTIAPRSRFVISTLELDDGATDLVVERIGNGLNNDADTISLFAPDGLAVHVVSYGDDALPAPDRGLSIALDPARWLVTAEPTPGAAGVTPLLDDSLRSASVKQPISDEERLPIVASPQDDGSDAWMIVSFALIGVILTLIIRRWRPDDPEPEQTPEPTAYSGPAADPSPDDGLERGDDPGDERGRR